MKDAICQMIGHHVAAKRVLSRQTQEAVAYQVGVSRQALSEIERGTQAPRWETLYMLAEVLRCEVYDLLPTVKQVRGRV